jgi:3-dehydrosphinganine reductase
MVAIAISLTTLLCLSVVVVFLIALFMIYLRWDPLKGPSHLDLAGKHVVITGGSSGIGKALAILCVKQKALVTIIARNQNKLDEAVEEITGKVPNCKVQAKSADVTNFDNLSQAINEASRHFSRPVDVLVCSAGATNPLRFEDLSVSDFENVMNVNFLGIVNSVKVVLPGMKQRKFGRIVFISSQVGQLGMFGYTAYSASKFAVRGFAESLYPEVKPHGIFISISYPPDTDTPMVCFTVICFS